MLTLKMTVDPQYPHLALEDCGNLVHVVLDMLAAGPSDGPDISSKGAIGLMDMLYCVSDALKDVQQLIHAMPQFSRAVPGAHPAPVVPKLTEPKPQHRSRTAA